MRHARAAIVLIFGVIAVTFTCGLLATGAPCVSGPARPVDAPALADQLGRIEPGARFELRLTPADLNAYLAAYFDERDHAMLTAAAVAFGKNHIALDLCARGILFRPVPMHIALVVEQAQRAPQLSCSAWSIGRIKMPRPLRELLARRLNAEWARIDTVWHIEQWTVEEDSLYVAGIRRP